MNQHQSAPAAVLEPSEVRHPGRRIAFFGRLPPFTRRQRLVFWIVTTAGFFSQYDNALLNLALKQIQQGLRIAEASLGPILSIVRLGNLPSLLLTPLADRYGRRTLLLYTVLAYTVFTGLTAFSWNAASFVTLRFLSVVFSAAEGSVALVILVEEVDAGVRGWAVGLLGALASCGFGTAALVFALINVIPFGWRGLYALALIPLAIIIPLRRVLPETHRFEQASAAAAAQDALAPFRALLREYPRRFWMLFGVSFLGPMGGAAGGMMTSKYLQEAHHWSPGNVSSLIFIGGALGILGNVVAGRLSDRFGRRTMGASFMFLAPFFAVTFFNSSGPVMVVAWILDIFCDTASATIFNAYGAELFPTSYRSTAISALAAGNTIGAAIGLAIESVLYTMTGSHWRAVSILAIFWVIAPILIITFFPETAGLELETISPERLADAVTS